MKKAVSHVESFLERQEGASKGTVVLATVYGDVHDIGKNLVKTILSNNGYTVIDLGKQVPAETIITKAVEAKADAIGLSALLVNTSKQMPLIVNELQRRGLKLPVLVGGAAINRRFGWRILFTEDGAPYEPGVFYCKDAFEGLATIDAYLDPQRRPELLERLFADAGRELGREVGAKPADQSGRALRSHPAPLPVPADLTWGPRVVRADAAGDGVPAPGKERAVPPVVGGQERPRRGVGAAAGRVRKAPGAYDPPGARRKLAEAAGGVRLLALPGGWRLL